MKKFLNKSKWIYYTLGIISGLLVISALFFMNQYRYVRINYNKNLVKDVVTGEEKTVITYDKTAKLNSADQQYLFSFINNLATGQYSDPEIVLYENVGDTKKLTEAPHLAGDFIEQNKTLSILLTKVDGQYKYIEQTGSGYEQSYGLKFDVLDDLRLFRNKLDSYNNLILAYGIVSLVCFALLIVLSNHNRKIYYKSNLIGGILIPAVNIIFSLILIINAFSLLSNFSNSENIAIYNVVSTLNNSSIASKNVRVTDTDAANLQSLQNIANNFNINSATILGYIVFFGLTAAYNVFLIVFAFLKYKDTEKERNETLEKARLAGEKA